MAYDNLYMFAQSQVLQAKLHFGKIHQIKIATKIIFRIVNLLIVNSCTHWLQMSSFFYFFG